MLTPVAEARLLEGKILAAQFQNEIAKFTSELLAKKGGRVSLLALRAGDDRASDWYIGQQEKLAAKLGIGFEKTLPGEIRDQKTLLEKIGAANRSAVTGVFLAMPFPEGFDADQALLALDPKKDVEGIHPASLGLIVLRRARLIPPTAYAALQLIEHAARELKRPLRGMKAVIAGQSAIVGRPLQMLLGERRVTTTVCNTGTSAEELMNAVLSSDIVVACAGQPGLVKGGWIRAGSIVIDVGTTEVNGKLVGDIEFDEARKRAAFITPVPGGVGPLTVTMLMQNLINACKWQQGVS